MNETSAVEIDVAEVGGCRRRLNVRVPPEDVSKEFDETVRRYARAIRMPGFRRGKAPPALVRKRFSREIEEEVRDHLVRQGLKEALERHELHPLHDPVVEGGPVKEGEGYAYSALFEVRPRIHLGEYKGLTVSVPEPTVSDEDVAAALDSLRERMAKFVPVEPRPIVAGDFVLVDLEGVYEDGKGNDFRHEGVMVEVGSDRNLVEFNAALPAMQVGESKSFTVAYPSNFESENLAGRQVRYTLTVKELKIKELPVLDDELPKDLGKPGSLSDLREEIRRDLASAARTEADRRARESLLRQLIETHRTEVPEIMVEEQLNFQIEDIVRGMILRGIHPGKTDVDWSEVRTKEKPLAAQRVLGILILDEIARNEGLDVSEAEVQRRIAEEARVRAAKAEEFRKRMEDPGRRQALKNQLVREKSLDFLLKNATITH